MNCSIVILQRTAVLVLSLFLITTNPAAQEFVHATPAGFIVMLGNGFPKDFSYRVYRESSQSPTKQVAEIHAPADYEEFTINASRASNHLTNLDPLDKAAAKRYWKYFETHQNVDSLILLDFAIGSLSMGLAWLDTSVSTMETVTYRVEKWDGNQSIVLFESLPTTFSAPIIEVETMTHSAEYDGITVLAKWHGASRSDLQKYIVYRRANLQGAFERQKWSASYRPQQDTFFIYAGDTTTQKYQVYEYFVRPIDLFGNKGQASKIITQATFSERDFPYLAEFEAVSLRNRSVRISWQFEQLPFIRSIKLLRSPFFDSAFVQIAELPLTDTSFVDVLPVAMENYYYRLQLNGPQGISKLTASTAAMYQEKSKPDPPVNISGIGTAKGVELRWTDEYPTTRGFYTYRKSPSDDSMQLISQVIPLDTSRSYIYQDTSLTLQGNTFYDYAIRTINDGYQLSEFSDTITVRPLLPTLVAIPTGLKIKQHDRGAILIWNDLSKFNKDLAGYRILRQRHDETEPRPLSATLDYRTNHFIDSSIMKGYQYRYYVQAFDWFGGESDLSTSVTISSPRAIPITPSGVTAAQTTKGVRIRWSAVLQDNLDAYKIYRATPESKPIEIGRSPIDQPHYEDLSTKSGTLYFYTITVTDDLGVEGVQSKSISIRTQ